MSEEDCKFLSDVCQTILELSDISEPDAIKYGVYSLADEIFRFSIERVQTAQALGLTQIVKI